MSIDRLIYNRGQAEFNQDVVKVVNQILDLIDGRTLRVTGDVTMRQDDMFVFIDGAHTTLTITLPSAKQQSKRIFIKDAHLVGAHDTITLAALSGETVEGASTHNITGAESAIWLASDGVGGWWHLTGA